MIRLRRTGPVTQIAMARAVLGRPLFMACAYYLDGLLVDTGPPITSPELDRLLDEMKVQTVVLSHAHEDHAGANSRLQARGLTADGPRAAGHRTLLCEREDRRRRPRALQRKLDFLERLRDEAHDRQARGMDARRIRIELLGRETWWPLITGGHFSKQNLIDALLKDDPA